MLLYEHPLAEAAGLEPARPFQAITGFQPAYCTSRCFRGGDGATRTHTALQPSSLSRGRIAPMSVSMADGRGLEPLQPYSPHRFRGGVVRQYGHP